MKLSHPCECFSSERRGTSAEWPNRVRQGQRYPQVGFVMGIVRHSKCQDISRGWCNSPHEYIIIYTWLIGKNLSTAIWWSLRVYSRPPSLHVGIGWYRLKLRTPKRFLEEKHELLCVRNWWISVGCVLAPEVFDLLHLQSLGTIPCRGLKGGTLIICTGSIHWFWGWSQMFFFNDHESKGNDTNTCICGMYRSTNLWDCLFHWMWLQETHRFSMTSIPY